MQLPEFSSSEPIESALECLPSPVVKAIESYGNAHGLTISQVIELAFASFLGHDSVSFGEVDNYLTPGQLQEELKILHLKNAVVKKVLKEAGLYDSSIFSNSPES